MKGFVVAREYAQEVLRVRAELKAVGLEQGLALFPLTEELVKSVGSAGQLEPLPGFEYLSENLCALLARISDLCPLLYFETEYFGGMGAQIAMVFDKGNVVFGPRKHKTNDGKTDRSPISEALQVLGAKKRPQDFDEFDSVGLGRYRDSEEWLSSIPQ